MEREKKPKHFIHNPSYPGGNKAFADFIYQNLRYPKLALEAGLEGVVVLRYDIDNQGVVGDVQVLKGIGMGCDEEAVRVVKLLRFDVPKNRGLRVTFHKNVRVQFKLPKPAPLPVPPPEAQGQPAASFQLNYSITPAEKPAAPDEKKPAGNSYSITYNLG